MVTDPPYGIELDSLGPGFNSLSRGTAAQEVSLRRGFFVQFTVRTHELVPPPGGPLVAATDGMRLDLRRHAD
jgi:hypothetical protein